MRRTYKYRIYPTGGQELELNARLESCRKLYNHFVSERKSLWEENKRSTTLYTQIGSLKELKHNTPALQEVYSQVLQNVAVRVDLAYQAFFRRLKSGETPGYPRFKSYGRYDSMTFPQYGKGVKIVDDRVRVTGIGHIKVVMHRPLEGTPKTVTVKRSSTDKWYVSFSCEIEKKEPLPKSPVNIGIDVGLASFAHLSDDNIIKNPRFFKQEELNLAKAQRKLDKVSVKDKSGKVLNAKSKERIAAKKVVSRVHERVKFKRDNFAHQESRKIINKYQIICVEDLEVNRLKEHSFKCLRKSISDVSWTTFFNLLHVKAEEAGRTLIAVNPAYTSQDCSRCGHRKKKTLSERVHSCECCGIIIDRDLNASLNILRIGLDSLGANP